MRSAYCFAPLRCSPVVRMIRLRSARRPARTTQPTETARAPEPDASAGARQCGSYVEHLFADPRLDPIRDKVPLVLRSGAVTPPSWPMGQAHSAEKQAIKVWMSVREQAQQYQLEHRGPPSPLLVHTRQLVTRAILQLVQRRNDLRRVRQADSGARFRIPGGSSAPVAGRAVLHSFNQSTGQNPSQPERRPP